MEGTHHLEVVSEFGLCGGLPPFLGETGAVAHLCSLDNTFACLFFDKLLYRLTIN